jgi:hypothetical protein
MFRNFLRNGLEAMTVDEMILKALERGPVTVNDIANDISKHFIGRVRLKVEKLRVRGVVIREGKGGAHRKFTYKLVRPDLAAKALAEKGGLARAGKTEPAVRNLNARGRALGNARAIAPKV